MIGIAHHGKQTGHSEVKACGQKIFDTSLLLYPRTVRYLAPRAAPAAETDPRSFLVVSSHLFLTLIPMMNTMTTYSAAAVIVCCSGRWNSDRDKPCLLA